MTEIQELASEEILPVKTTVGGEFWYTDSARVRNRLVCGKVDRYVADTSYSVITNGLELTFYDEQGLITGVLTSRRGLILDKSGIMEAQDSVRFKNNEGEELLTERLVWDRDSASVYTQNPVTIKKRDGILYGKGLVSDQGFSNYRILEPSGVLYVNESDSTNQ